MDQDTNKRNITSALVQPSCDHFWVSRVLCAIKGGRCERWLDGRPGVADTGHPYGENTEEEEEGETNNSGKQNKKKKTQIAVIKRVWCYTCSRLSFFYRLVSSTYLTWIPVLPTTTLHNNVLRHTHTHTHHTTSKSHFARIVCERVRVTCITAKGKSLSKKNFTHTRIFMTPNRNFRNLQKLKKPNV